jgi:hypothetical protein
MNRTVLAVLLLAIGLLVPHGAVRAQGYGDGPGCGFGAMIFDGNKKVLHQILAATTNGILGNQTFGISSGTLGCTNDGIVMNDQKAVVYARANFDNLSQEMARGGGEHLAALATLMGVPAQQQPAFFALTQERYGELYQSDATTADEMLVALNDQMSGHPELQTVALR